MKRRYSSIVFSTVAALCAFSSISVAQAAPPRYVATDLGVLSGGTQSYGIALNDQGQVVGYGRISEGFRAFLWDSVNGMKSLGLLPGGNFSAAYGINNQSQVVGYGTTTTTSHAFLWDSVNGIQSLGLLPNGGFSQAVDINNQGQVVGIATNSNGLARGFLWDAVNGMQELSPLVGHFQSQADGINNHGQVVGSSITGLNYHGVIWDPSGQIVELGTLPGAISTRGLDINDRGQVVGTSITVDFPTDSTAFFWDEATGIQNIGRLPGDTFALANAINEEGLVIGTSGRQGSTSSFLWSSELGLWNLSSLVDNVNNLTFGASDINNQGQIAATATVGNQVHAFLLTPVAVAVPEPGSLALLLGIGSIGVGCLIRRKRTQ